MKTFRILGMLVLLAPFACDTGDTGAEGETGGVISTTSGGEGGDSGGDTGVPGNAYCEEVSDWPDQYVALEAEVLVLVNQRRAEGANCGSEGNFAPAPALGGHGGLDCAARVHSKDMVDRGYFDHTNPDGEQPWDRMDQAGYNWSAAGENIAGGSPDAAGTVQQWMDSDGHCANIMSPDFTELGVGYYPGGQWGHMWTQVFGRPQ